MILNSSYYSVHSQMHEFGTFLGGSNFIGDIGSSSYIKPNSFSFGLTELILMQTPHVQKT